LGAKPATPTHTEREPVHPEQRERHFAAFLDFVRGADDVDRSALRSRTLRSLYAEFCTVRRETRRTDALLFRELKRLGVERYRQPTPPRVWLYCIPPARPRRKRPRGARRG
jgi:hypothetical protein